MTAVYITAHFHSKRDNFSDAYYSSPGFEINLARLFLICK